MAKTGTSNAPAACRNAESQETIASSCETSASESASGSPAVVAIPGPLGSPASVW